MKDKKPLIIQFVVGVILIGGGLLTQFDYYSLCFCMGFGLALGSIAQIVRIVYWQNPKRQLNMKKKSRSIH
jgi:hypothetical protein